MTRLNRTDRRKLEVELRSLPTPPPPADLLDRLKAEIPESLGAANDVDEAATAPAASRPDAPSRRWPLRLAASLALAVLGGLVAWQVDERFAPTPPRAAGARPEVAAEASEPQTADRSLASAPPAAQQLGATEPFAEGDTTK